MIDISLYYLSQLWFFLLNSNVIEVASVYFKEISILKKIRYIKLLINFDQKVIVTKLNNKINLI